MDRQRARRWSFFTLLFRASHGDDDEGKDDITNDKPLANAQVKSKPQTKTLKIKHHGSPQMEFPSFQVFLR